ncbi:MAG: glycosyltransferase family 2 protein [Candidatus Thorarchaeota archaeon]|jgi:glycosyltransferase involved in cell wall biosynthesis
MTSVAIIIPVFYREHLEKSIKSILENNCDIIIVNDSETPLRFDHERVTIIDNERNMGVGISRNRGVNLALEKGYDLIGFVDSDSVLSRQWRHECEKTLVDPDVLGVSGLALNPNQRSRIARVKFVLKDYSRRKGIPFQIDCSLFKREVFTISNFGTRRVGEDTYFLHKLEKNTLVVNEKAISYHHEVESTRDFFKKEIVGALYSLSRPRDVARIFLLTPLTCFKLLRRWKYHYDYTYAALVWILRQVAWNMAYALGRLF